MKALLIAVLVLSLNLSVFPARSATPLVLVGNSSEMKEINEVLLTGTVTSPRSSALSTEVSGLVEAVIVDEGQRVRQGDVILRLDRELEQLKLEAAMAQTRQAELELAETKRRLVDAKRLAQQKTISENDVQSLQAEVSINEAILLRTRSEQKQQQVRLRWHRVFAPFDGVISQKFTEAGEWISPGDAIAELISLDNLRIEFQVPQSVFPKTRRDTPIQIRLDAIPDTVFDGKINAIVPIANAEARTFMIRVSIDTDESLLTPGMSANAVLRLDTGNKAVVVPRDAILRQPDGRTKVWVVNPDMTVTERIVITGPSFNANMVIRKGLKANEKIVIRGNESLRENQTISIKQE
jgi:RND family efflux transporter MFP subunit